MQWRYSEAPGSRGCKSWTLYGPSTLASLAMKAQKHLYFHPPILTNFYKATIESILTSCNSVWFAKPQTERHCREWWRLQKNIWTSLSSTQDITHRCWLTKGQYITKDPTQPHHGLFSLLPSSKRFCSIRCRTARLCKFFFPMPSDSWTLNNSSLSGLPSLNLLLRALDYIYVQYLMCSWNFLLWRKHLVPMFHQLNVHFLYCWMTIKLSIFQKPASHSVSIAKQSDFESHVVWISGENPVRSKSMARSMLWSMVAMLPSEASFLEHTDRNMLTVVV